MQSSQSPCVLDRGMRVWIKKTAKMNIWRMPSHMDLEDLIAEGYLCFAKCKDRYTAVTHQPKMMALVKRSFHNRITDLARERTKLHEVPAASLDSDEGFSEAILGAQDDEFFALLDLVKSAPDDVRSVLQLFIDDGNIFRNNTRRFLNGKRETTNTMLCRALGKNPALVDLPKMVHDYLTGKAFRLADLKLC